MFDAPGGGGDDDEPVPGAPPSGWLLESVELSFMSAGEPVVAGLSSLVIRLASAESGEEDALECCFNAIICFISSSMVSSELFSSFLVLSCFSSISCI